MQRDVQSTGKASTYGCFNRRDFADYHFAQNGWWIDGQSRVAKLVRVPHVLTRDCQYTHSELGQRDPGCTGCDHRQDGLDNPHRL